MISRASAPNSKYTGIPCSEKIAGDDLRWLRPKGHIKTVASIMLRPWKDDDLEPFAEMNADAKVMAFFPKPLSKDESAEFLTLIRTRMNERGWGFWAVEVDGAFAGFTGLSEPKFVAHFTPCVEIGWRFGARIGAGALPMPRLWRRSRLALRT